VRSVTFLAIFVDSRVRFQAVDLPVAEFTLHSLAAVAQKEALDISSRTRDALAAEKARGSILCIPANLTDETKLKGLAAQQAKSADRYQQSAGRAAGSAATGYQGQSAGYCGAVQPAGLHYSAREGFPPNGRPALTPYGQRGKLIQYAPTLSRGRFDSIGEKAPVAAEASNFCKRRFIVDRTAATGSTP
jgi:hypothetical protein